VTEAVEVFREDLGIFDERAVLNAGAGMSADLTVVVDAFEQKFHLERKTPPGHVIIIELEESVLENRFREQLEVEMLGEEPGCSGFAGTDISGESNEHE
jgi:hypothetical protein